MLASQHWMNKAALYELLSVSFRFPTEETANVIVSGEFAEALQEIGRLDEVDGALLEECASDLAGYVGQNSDDVFHRLRKEHTRLFVGQGSYLVSPYAGIWDAEQNGRPALLMVNPESMAIERFMRRCGVGQPEGTNEPLDHIASLLEFLYYLCLVKAGAVQPPAHASIQEHDYELFFDAHVAGFARAFGQRVVDETSEPFLASAARVLLRALR